MIGGILLLTLATAAAALLAAADAALITDSTSDLEEPPSARVERDQVHRSFSLARLVSLLLAGAAIWMTVHGLASHGSRVGAGLALSVLVVVLVECIARSIGDAVGGKALRALKPVERLLRFPVAPAAAFGGWLESALDRILPPRVASEDDTAATAEQFREVVAADAEVTRDERVLLDGVFTLRETEVREVMVPRVEVVAIERDTPWSEVVDRLRSTGHARMPVFTQAIDEIAGILYAKDLLPAIVADEEPADGWATRVRPAHFIPATKTLDAQLRDFKSSGTHIAIVTDEYGGTAGIVTIEDILEEIVGEIEDEFDVAPQPTLLLAGGALVLSGSENIRDLETRHQMRFPRDEGFETLAGFMLFKLGHIPRGGETVEHEGHRFTVLNMDGHRIAKVKVEAVQKPAASTA